MGAYYHALPTDVLKRRRRHYRRLEHQLRTEQGETARIVRGRIRLIDEALRSHGLPR